MVLGQLPVPGRPTYFDYSRARAFCPCSRCGWGLFGHFFSRLLFLFPSPSLWETARYGLKYCLKGPLNAKQPTNQTTVGQGPTALAVGAGGGCLDIFTLIYPFSPLLPLFGRRPDID